MTRIASCSCGQLQLRCPDTPVRVSLCHCLACQQRTGSVFSVQARFRLGDIQASGEASEFTRAGDSGQSALFRFCPHCGNTVWWTSEYDPTLALVAVGAFADPAFPAPQVAVYEARRHAWTELPALEHIEHWD